MLSEDERKAIVESGPIYLDNGMRATLAGWKDPDMCGVTSCEPGFWSMPWETAADVVKRPGRRMTRMDALFRWRGGWLGCTPRPQDFQVPEDYDRYMARRSAQARGD